ncbi:MAG: glycosyltransferase family 4 protein [Methanomassiliicoccales archaeon]|nr:glycosyltransferase family 4 protein [Methanomassiliicoccales archaeon]
MRVAIATPEFLPNWGGIGTYVTLLAKELPDDIEVHVITLKRGDGPIETPETKDILDKIEVHYLGSAEDFFLYNNQFQFNMLAKFKALKAQHRFDLLHANHAQMPDLFLRFLDPDTPSLTTVHTTIDSQRMGTRRSRMPLRKLERSEKMTYLMLPMLRALERCYFSKCHHAIFVSEFIRRLYSKIYPMPADWRIVHNGVDTYMFRPRPMDECARRYPQLEGRDVILFSGRMIALKGIDMAIRSFSLIHKETDAIMVFAGAGKMEPWKEMLEQLGVPEDRYLFLGGVPYLEMPYLYSMASAFMLPSYSESFPMTVLEAMSCQVPVIATDVGGIPEMIDSNRNGLLVQPGNPKNLSAALLKVLGDRKFGARLASNARAKACEELSASKMASSTAEMYRRVLEGRE